MANLRAPLTGAFAVVGGAPDLRAPLVEVQAVTAGIPSLRGSLALVEAVTGGVPKLRGCLIIVQAVVQPDPERPVASLVFPTLIGLAWNVTKGFEFNNVVPQGANLLDSAIAYAQYPIWNFELTFEYLPDGSPWQSNSDMRTLAGFILQVQGRFQPWLFHDPDDYHVVGGGIATADGTTNQWPFYRNFGGFSEPVGQLDLSTIASFASSAVNTGTSQINIPNHGLTTGQDPPMFISNSGGSLPTGLSASTPYWPIVVDANHIQLAATQPDALASTNVTLSATGSGTNTLAKGWAAYGTIAETDSVPGSGPYTITVAKASHFVSDGGVTISGSPLVKVASSPASGQYSVNQATGVYTFNSAQASASAVITYTYLLTATASLTLPNQLVFSPAPANGTIITADFDFYFVCRFLEDKFELDKFMYNLWEMKKLPFRSVLQ